MRCLRPSLIATYMVMISVAAFSVPALADPSGFHYGGRIVSADGKPAAGPVDLQIKFFDDATAGVQVGPTKTMNDVVLKQGVFDIEIDLTASERDQVFGVAGLVFMQVKDLGTGKTYPRQSFGAVPYALRVPVDGTTIGYNADGQLEVQDVSGVQQSGVKLDGGANDVTIQAAPGSDPMTLTLPDNPGTSGFVLTTDGTGALTWTNKASAGGGDMLSTNNLGDVANTGTARTNLGLGNVSNTNVLDTFTQNDAQYLGTDEVRARDAGGLRLSDDGGNGVFVQDGGNVGIGTTSPSTMLDVGGGIFSTKEIASQTSSAIALRKRGASGDSTAAVLSGAELGVFGNYGWDGTAYGRGAYVLARATENFGTSSHGASYTIFTTANGANDGTARLFVGSDGNVGIGTTTPAMRLDIADANGTDITARLSTKSSGGNSTRALITAGADTGLLQFTADAGINGSARGMAFTVGATEALRIVNGGNVGIGTATPGDKLQVEGKIRSQQLCYTDGTNCKDLTVPWAAGSLTSVGINPPAAGMTASADVTGAGGDITLALADDLAAVEGLGTTGIVRRTGANTWSTITDNSATWNDATLSGIAAVAPTAGQMVYATGADTFSTITTTTPGRDMLTAADTTAQKTLLALNNVSNTNVLNTFTQNDAQYLGTDEVRARDSGGLKLYDDAGLGLFVEDGGYVGVGTTNPATALDVNGSIRSNTGYHLTHSGGQTFTLTKSGINELMAANDNTTNAYFEVGSTVSSTRGFDGAFRAWGSETGGWVNYIEMGQIGSTHGVIRSTGNLFLNPTGNVGVGTATPDRKLTVYENIDESSTFNGQLLLNGASTSAGQESRAIFSTGSHGNASIAGGYTAVDQGYLTFGTRTASVISEKMRITTEGNVGIGTTAPGQKLSVDGTLGIIEGGASPTYHTIFQGGNQSADITYTLPTTAPAANGSVLSSTTGGTLSWAQSSSGIVAKVKSANETLTSDASMQNDSELNFAVAANEKWIFHAVLYVTTSNANPDFQVAVSGPASPTTVFYTGCTGNITFSAGCIVSDVATAFDTSMSYNWTAATNPGVWILDGSIVNGANAGTVSISWAQRISDPGSTILKAGSFIQATRQ